MSALAFDFLCSVFKEHHESTQPGGRRCSALFSSAFCRDHVSCELYERRLHGGRLSVPPEGWIRSGFKLYSPSGSLSSDGLADQRGFVERASH